MPSPRSDEIDRVHSPVRRAFGLVLGVGLALASCTDTIRLAQDFADSGGGTLAGTGGTSTTSGTGGASASSGTGAAGEGPCQMSYCQGKLYHCGNCMDDDGDGLIDSADPECTGPCDDTEDSYFGGIPGQNNSPCHEDCYFDQDTGAGNDHCYWNQACDMRSKMPDYPPSGDARCVYDENARTAGTTATCADLRATQDPSCLSYCLPLAPNGCDCFGCCELPADSGSYVWIGSADRTGGTCTPDKVSDPTACHPCTPVQSCFNACDPCEICVGRTAPAPSCSGSGTSQCQGGATPCGQPGQAGCGSNEYCVTGCCEAAPK